MSYNIGDMRGYLKLVKFSKEVNHCSETRKPLQTFYHYGKTRLIGLLRDVGLEKSRNVIAN